MIALILKFIPMLGMLKGKGKLIAGGLVLLLVLGTNLYIGSLKNDISELEGTVILITDDLLECQDANVSLLDATLELKAANSSLAAAVEVSAEVRESAAMAAYYRNQRAAEALLNTKQELEELRNGNPTCEQLSKIDMGTACPAVVERLRDLADPDYSD